MKLIIDIPKEAYELLQNDGVDWLGAENILDAVSKGTPLPKGHGRLIDADAFRLYCFRKNWDRRLSAGGLATINMYLESGAPTIIEADKESENKND